MKTTSNPSGAPVTRKVSEGVIQPVTLFNVNGDPLSDYEIAGLLIRADDGAIIALGDTNDGPVPPGAAGSVISLLRAISRDTVNRASDATVTSVADTTTEGLLVAPRVGRRGLSVTNTSSGILYLLAGNTGIASATNFTVRLAQFDYWEAPEIGFTGALRGVWSVDNNDGAALVSEYI